MSAFRIEVPVSPVAPNRPTRYCAIGLALRRFYRSLVRFASAMLEVVSEQVELGLEVVYLGSANTTA